MTRNDDWVRAVTMVEWELGKLDVLVNNAGIVTFNGTTETTDEERAQVIAVNQTGVFMGMRASIPASCFGVRTPRNPCELVCPVAH